jgi:ABC-type transport system involved in cytochrome c biogenesis permease subunit
MGWFRPLNRAGYALAVIAFVVHTFGLFARMYIQDRNLVFVTNLYSSAIFIGWGCLGVCLFIEHFYRNSIALVVGSATAGISAGVIAHYLSLSGDTMEMMQAVLDTNFWLATHVTTVTLGYTATVVAGFLGIAYIFLGVFTPFLNRKLEDIFAADETAAGLFRGELLGSAISKMTYGVLCFALLLSFVGTVLGGIWADQSWGRFWGWDPKENGALLIVIWNALILHARWGGMVKARGIATLAVAGNIVTSWSWFGTNLLGVGLHAYGGGGPLSTAVVWLFIFVGSQALIIGLGCIPLKYWLSYLPTPPAGPPHATPKPPQMSAVAVPS